MGDEALRRPLALLGEHDRDRSGAAAGQRQVVDVAADRISVAWIRSTPFGRSAGQAWHPVAALPLIIVAVTAACTGQTMLPDADFEVVVSTLPCTYCDWAQLTELHAICILTEDKRVSRNEADPRQQMAQPQLGPSASVSPMPAIKGAELESWSLIKDSPHPQDFRDHLARFPRGESKQMALDRLAALGEQAYRRTVGESRLREFLKQFPDSPHAAEVRKRLAKQVAANKRPRRRDRRATAPKAPIEERLRSLLEGTYVCACFVSFTLLALLAEFTHGRGSTGSIFVPVTYVITCVVTGLIGDRLAASFIASTDHLGPWKRKLAVTAGAVGWQITTYVLVMLAGNIVELGRSVFLPAVPWATGWIAVPIVMLAALAAFALTQWLVKRLNSPNKVFISYRRDDGAATAARIGDRLRFGIGRSRVFMDLDNLQPGQRWDQELHKSLAECTVLIAVIGRRWMDLLNQRMKNGERDIVREEIAAALNRGMPVIPVLVEGAALPDGHLLSSDLRNLVLHQKFSIADDHRFGRDVDDLIASIRKTS